jgi:ketosteroid isomerase-like protein
VTTPSSSPAWGSGPSRSTSPTAIAAARRRFPGSVVRYQTADLLDPPPPWQQAFDLVVESLTLQRARTAVRDRLPARSQQSVLRVLGDRQTTAIVRRYADALERGDVDALVSMLTQDATWSMPPVPTWFRGHEAIREFLVGYPLKQRWQHRPARANGQAAVACYLFDQARGGYLPAVIDVLTLAGEKIAAVTAFLAAETLPPHSGAWITGTELFARFGLPATPSRAPALT